MLLADEGDLVALVDREVELGEDLPALDGLGRGPSTLTTLFPTSRSGLKPTKGKRLRRGHEVVELELLEDLLARGRLLALGRVGGEALDEFLEVLGLLLVLLLQVLLLLDEDAVHLVPEIVVARVHPHLAVVDVARCGCRPR